MIKYLLQEIEKCPNPVFTKQGLLSLSPKDYDYYLDKKIIAYSRPDETDMERIDYPRCQHGCSLTIVPVDGGFEGICLDHPEENPIPIKEEDLGRYAISVETLLNHIRTANKLDGKLHTIDGRYYYAGYKIYDNQRTGFIFIRDISKEPLASILGLKHLCREDNNLIVLTPSSKIEDVNLEATLHHENIAQLTIADSINPQTFYLPIEKFITGLLKPIAIKKSCGKKKRPTATEKRNRDRAVLAAAIKIGEKYGRLPTVSEVAEETQYTAGQIYATAPYKEGKIARRTAKPTKEMTGSSIATNEYFGVNSMSHSRADRLSKSQQIERDSLIDESAADDDRDEQQHKRYLRNKKKIDSEK